MDRSRPKADVGEADDRVIGLAAVLRGPGAAAITGASLDVDGGWTAH
jgi:hypothetical protein